MSNPEKKTLEDLIAGISWILAYSDNEKVSLNVGFYYMANAAGRLIGTLLSGLLFMIGRNASVGLQYCLYLHPKLGENRKTKTV